MCSVTNSHARSMVPSSALLGAAIGVVATSLMAFAMLRHGEGASAQRVAWSFFSGWVVKIAFTLGLLVVAFRSPGIAAGPLLATLALGVASTGLATWVFFVVVSNCGPNFLSLINYIIPALAFAAGALLLAEPVNSSQFLGLGAICAGIAISQRRRSRGR